MESDKNSNNPDTFNTSSLLHTVVSIEKPHKTNLSPPQCHDCQFYGHKKFAVSSLRKITRPRSAPKTANFRPNAHCALVITPLLTKDVPDVQKKKTAKANISSFRPKIASPCSALESRQIHSRTHICTMYNKKHFQMVHVYYHSNDEIVAKIGLNPITCTS